MVLNRTVTVCVFCKRGRGPARGEYRLPFAFLRWAAKLLKSLKTAMGSYWKKLTWIWVWRHSRLGLAPRRLGFGATPVWAGAAPVGIDGTMPTVNAIRAIGLCLCICATNKAKMHNAESVHDNSRRAPTRACQIG
jgi:hypothetical protein